MHVFTMSIQIFETMSAPAPPNTPYALLAFMPSAILVRIAAWVGDRRMMCSEGIAVAIRNDNLWDWACLPCFEVLVSSTIDYDDDVAKVSCSSTFACDPVQLSPRSEV